MTLKGILIILSKAEKLKKEKCSAVSIIMVRTEKELSKKDGEYHAAISVER